MSARPWMSPDDPRHGSYAGAVAHWLEAKDRPCDDCARAEWRYRKQRKMDALRGNPRSVPSIGILRRIRALHAVGWTGPQMAAEAGISVHSMRSIGYHGSDIIHSRTARAIVAAYDRMSMTWPEGQYANRSRAMAVRRGWAPPLAWDCIDTDAAPDYGSIDIDVDPVVIDRICSGDWRLSANLAERVAVLERWQAAGLADNEVERRTGWNVARDIRPHLRSKDAA